MSDIALLQRLFAYDAWANREVLNALTASEAPVEPGVRLLNHILSAQKLWLERLTGQPQSMPVWPETGLEQCKQLVAEMQRAWEQYLASLDESKLAGLSSYTNSKGEHFDSKAGDILMHVVLHSAYHRGQIASRMRDAGQTPAYTDYIHGVRQGFF